MIAVAKQARALGAFAEWQPRYAQHGIATFPVVIDGSGKRPAVKGYLKAGSDLSRDLALRFAANDAFGFALGRYNRITVLDVDTRDDRSLSEALAKHGPSPLIIRSGSGNWQAGIATGRGSPRSTMGPRSPDRCPRRRLCRRAAVSRDTRSVGDSSGQPRVSSGFPRCKPSISSSPPPRRLCGPRSAGSGRS